MRMGRLQCRGERGAGHAEIPGPFSGFGFPWATVSFGPGKRQPKIGAGASLGKKGAGGMAHSGPFWGLWFTEMGRGPQFGDFTGAIGRQ